MEQEGGFSGPGGANDDEHVGGDACKVLIFHDILSPYKKKACRYTGGLLGGFVGNCKAIIVEDGDDGRRRMGHSRRGASVSADGQIARPLGRRMAGGQSRTPRAHGRRPKPGNGKTEEVGAWPEAKAGATQKKQKERAEGKREERMEGIVGHQGGKGAG